MGMENIINAIVAGAAMAAGIVVFLSILLAFAYLLVWIMEKTQK